MSTAIETQELTKRFRSMRSLRAAVFGPRDAIERVAVDGVSLSIPHGEVFGLLGQNGAGKTTLVRMLTTLLIPTSGTARIEGRDVVGDPHFARSRIGLINGDERSFYWRLTGRQNLEFFGALRHLDPATSASAIDRMASRLGMAEHLDRPFAKLSTGQRQALAIIRGLLDEPAIVFMDEPTRSLDPISAARLRRFVAEVVVGELGRTVVLATHSMPEAEDLCDRLAFIQDGRIVAQGSVSELRRAIGYGTRCELRLRDVPDGLSDRLGRLTGLAAITVGAAEADAQDGATAVVRLNLVTDDALPELMRALVSAGVAILACETSELSLEEIYIRTLGSQATTAPSAIAVPAR
jgi:ABC-2 type transport system ATP-binding protein